MKLKTIKHALTATASITAILIGLMFSGCKTKEQIQVVQPQITVTNTAPARAFNDEQYVWENFIFSTNQVKEAKQK